MAVLYRLFEWIIVLWSSTTGLPVNILKLCFTADLRFYWMRLIKTCENLQPDLKMRIPDVLKYTRRQPGTSRGWKQLFIHQRYTRRYPTMWVSNILQDATQVFKQRSLYKCIVRTLTEHNYFSKRIVGFVSLCLCTLSTAVIAWSWFCHYK